MLSILENIGLNNFTTIKLGGHSRYFCHCSNVTDIRDSINFARSKNIRFMAIGGGSNIIFPDEGFDGLIMKIDLKGISYRESGHNILATVQAGESWDEFVKVATEKGYAGIECLSGIPGNVGATPIQNVGAYGQEVKNTIHSVRAINTKSLKEVELKNNECDFSYRSSRFKSYDAEEYIILEVSYILKHNGRPTINYPELQKIISVDSLVEGREALTAVRNTVLSLRKKKSMIIDPEDQNTRSVGSFFLNPIVEQSVLSNIKNIWSEIGDGSVIPTFPFEEKVKIPAAWLIEKSGFQKGYKKNGVGISQNHTLALVNYNGSTTELLNLMKEIQSGVNKTFGVQLLPEANIITASY